MTTKIDEALSTFMMESFAERFEIKESIVLTLLDTVRKTYNLDVVYVLEKAPADYSFTYSYVSVTDWQKIHGKLASYVDLDESVTARWFTWYDQDTNTSTKQIANCSMIEQDQILHFALIEAGKFFGYVAFEKPRGTEWNEEERAALLKLGRVLRIYIGTRKGKERENDISIKIMEALTKSYTSMFYVDLVNDVYRAIDLSEMINNIVASKGGFEQAQMAYAETGVHADDRERFKSMMNIAYLSEHLSAQNRLVSCEYKRTIKGMSNRCRITAILVDMTPEDKPAHILLTLQDVADNEKAL